MSVRVHPRAAVRVRGVHSVGFEGEIKHAEAREGEIPSVGVDFKNNVGTYRRLMSSSFRS